MKALAGIKTVDSIKELEEVFKDYLIKEFNLDKNFSKYPLVELRISNLDLKDVISPNYIVEWQGMSDVVGEYIKELNFNVSCKIRIRK